MKSLKHLKGLIAVLIGICSCSEIFELDIRAKDIVILFPTDSSRSTKIAQTLKWEPLEGVRTYQVQIGSPSLAAPSAFYLDSTTSVTSLRVLLQPGSFQWRIRGLNAGYQTQYQERFFSIDSSNNLGEQEKLRLIKPTEGENISQTKVLFEWEALPAAKQYRFQLLSPSPFDTLITSTSLSKALPVNTQQYQWRVTALNATSSNTSGVGTFAVVAPAPPLEAPTLKTPASGASFRRVDLPITLTWERNGSNIQSDSVFIFASNQITILARTSVPTASFVLPANLLLDSGVYYWAVKSVGANGKKSPLSAKANFSILP